MSVLDKVVAAVIPSTTAGEINAIDLLKKDHDDVDALFKDYQLLAEGDGDAGDRRALSTRICGMLVVHAMIEEEIFYPAACTAARQRPNLLGARGIDNVDHQYSACPAAFIGIASP